MAVGAALTLSLLGGLERGGRCGVRAFRLRHGGIHSTGVSVFERACCALGEVGRCGASRVIGGDAPSLPQGLGMARAVGIGLWKSVGVLGEGPLQVRLKPLAPPMCGIFTRRSNFEREVHGQVVKPPGAAVFDARHGFGGVPVPSCAPTRAVRQVEPFAKLRPEMDAGRLC